MLGSDDPAGVSPEADGTRGTLPDWCRAHPPAPIQTKIARSKTGIAVGGRRWVSPAAGMSHTRLAHVNVRGSGEDNTASVIVVAPSVEESANSVAASLHLWWTPRDIGSTPPVEP
jgi:hypothetical protein